jgi:hypothetical protein
MANSIPDRPAIAMLKDPVADADVGVPLQTLTLNLLSATPTNATSNAVNGVFTWRPLAAIRLPGLELSIRVYI